MIRDCTPDDLPKVARLLRGLNRHHVLHLPKRFHDDCCDADLTAMLQAEMARGAHVLAYVIEGVPRAYLMWQWRITERNALCLDRKLGVLDHIYVEPCWRRRGVARRLVARFEADLRVKGGTGWITMVHHFNTASASMMQRAGAAPSVQIFERDLTAPPED